MVDVNIFKLQELLKTNNSESSSEDDEVIVLNKNRKLLKTLKFIFFEAN